MIFRLFVSLNDEDNVMHYFIILLRCPNIIIKQIKLRGWLVAKFHRIFYFNSIIINVKLSMRISYYSYYDEDDDYR